MIPSSRKFPLRREFLSFKKRAARHSTPLMTSYYLSSTATSRLSVIIPKKVSKSAVTRHALRRLTYDTLWPLVKNRRLDLVIVYPPRPLNVPLPTPQALLAVLPPLP